MPHWNAAPDRPYNGNPLRIIRTPHTRPIELLITCKIHVGTYTHWHDGRTQPCEAPDPCPACDEGKSYRWHGYLTGLLMPHGEHVIWEFTAPLLDQINAYIAQYGELRRAKLSAKRIKPYPTARQIIWIRPGDCTDPPLPPEPDIVKILLHIWGHDAERTNDTPYDPTYGRAIHPANHRKRETEEH